MIDRNIDILQRKVVVWKVFDDHVLVHFQGHLQLRLDICDRGSCDNAFKNVVIKQHRRPRKCNGFAFEFRGFFPSSW